MPDLQSQQLGSATPRWSNLWQVPTVLASVGLILGGIYFAGVSQPDHDFDSAYDQIEELITGHQYDAAATLLEQEISPNLEFATDEERGRFYAIAGDALYLKMKYEQTQTLDLMREVATRYGRAESLHFELDPVRIERWADASLLIGDIQSARDRLTTLDVLRIDNELGAQAEVVRNRVLRRIVDHSISSDDLSFDDTMAILKDYRQKTSLDPRDQMWASARQAQARIAAGHIRDAIDWLQIDMRRIEATITALAAESQGDFGELYALLGRAYYLSGEFAYGQEQINLALGMLDPLDPRVGEAQNTLGRILLAQSQFDDAFDAFSSTVIDFEGTRGYLPALLGRAEVHGILGRDAESQADFIELATLLPNAGERLDVTPGLAIDRLIDRHDSALATGQIKRALQYIVLAERFMAREDLPPEALVRLAMTNRAESERLLAEAGFAADDPASNEMVEASVRRRASEHFKIAGDYFVIHASTLAGDPVEDHAWMDSVLNAADTYDRAGYYDLAIVQFQAYVDGRSGDDPKRIDALFRMAQCYRAVFDCAKASKLYVQILDEHPKSTVAARCHVPLAACYEMLGQSASAEQQLLRVVSGNETVRPDATDYRDALIALGTLYYNAGDSTRAIEELSKALEYYPDDDRIEEVRFRLADSYRLAARSIAANLAEQTLPRSIVLEREALRTRHLNEARTLFGQVIDGYSGGGRTAVEHGQLNAIQRDYFRLAHLYRAHCAFDLGEFDEAITLYDQAARRYSEHPMSLIALIQIVSAYMEMGDRDRALTAHNRALLRLNQLPDDAINAEDSVLDEQAWRRWLDRLPPGVGITQEG